MAKRVVAPKTRNCGTMSESAFWSFIRSSLRQKSRWWKPIHAVKQAAKRLYRGSNKRQKVEFQCNRCKGWFPDKEVSVHHKIPCGSLTCATDLPGFVERLFCEREHLEVLCDGCHTEEHKKPIPEITAKAITKKSRKNGKTRN